MRQYACNGSHFSNQILVIHKRHPGYECAVLREDKGLCTFCSLQVQLVFCKQLENVSDSRLQEGGCTLQTPHVLSDTHTRCKTGSSFGSSLLTGGDFLLADEALVYYPAADMS